MRVAHNLLLSTAISTVLASVDANADTPGAISYVSRSLAEASITGGPWTLHQIVGRNRHDASGIAPPSTVSTPYNPPTTAYGTPYKGYCVDGQVQTAQGVNPMQPYYFPFVRANDGYLEGFFDYRPRNEQEATVSAISFDWGKRWVFTGEALGLNPYCPTDPTDPDNNNVIVDGMSVPYGSNSTNAADNGLGHAFVMTVAGVQRIYHLNRANGHIDSDQLVVHTLRRAAPSPLAGLPVLGYVSPLASRGYPTLEATAAATAGLQSPDAILGALKLGKVTTIIYVEKQLNASTTNQLPEHAELGANQYRYRQPAKSEQRRHHDPRRDDDRRHQFHRCRHGKRLAGPGHHRVQRHPLARQREHHPALERSLRHVLWRRQLPRQRFGRVPFHRLRRDDERRQQAVGPAELDGRLRVR